MGYNRDCKKALYERHPELANVSGITVGVRNHRFGNNFVQWAHMLMIAEMFNISNVYMLRKIDRRFAPQETIGSFLSDFRTVDGINVMFGPRPAGDSVFEDEMFWWWPRECPGRNAMANAGAQLRSNLMQHLPVVNVSEDALVLSLRSGDVWCAGDCAAVHAQPPCDFYRQAIKLSGATELLMATEFFDGPCVNPCSAVLEREFPHIRRVPQGMPIAVATLMAARRIAIGRSSLTEAITTMAAPDQVVFAFDSIMPDAIRPRDAQTTIPPHFDARPTAEYLAVCPQTSDWKHTAAQVQAVLNSTIAGWAWWNGTALTPVERAVM
jgi:hypothetical protein